MFLTDRWREWQHPEAGHDRGRRPYFEGWYVKVVSADKALRLAVIPGLFRSDSGGGGLRPGPRRRYRSQLVRVLSELGVLGGTGSFHGPGRAQSVHAGGVELDVELPDLHLRGQLDFTSELTPWPVTRRSPAPWGWYSYMPFMECYHGVVSFGHDVAGMLVLDGQEHRLTGARGYLEQDWGQAFPAGYVWMHSNTFTTPGVSLMASVALIPWLRGQFRGC